MSVAERFKKLRQDAEHGDDSGFTLTEEIASMTLMTIFMVMFTGSMIQLYGSSNKANAVTQSATQINIAFIRLDKQIRYASAIDQPTQVNGNWYVEFLTQNTGVQVCSQLRLANGVLSERSWTPAPTVAPTWNALASQVTNPSTAQPFTFYPVTPNTDPVHLNQRLEVKLQSTSGTNSAQTTSSTDVTFAALNSSASTGTNTPGTSVCFDQGRN